MKKKLLALVLSLTMVMSLAACGGSDDKKTDSGKDTTVDSGDVSGDSGDVTKPTETRTIKIGTWYDHFYDSTHTDIWDDPSVSDEELAQAHFDIVKEVEDKYNVRIEFVNLTFNGIQESINTSILSGKPDCDIYEVDLSFGIGAALNGFATNLEEVLPADADILSEEMVFSPVNIGIDKGVYLFGSNSGESVYYNTYMLAYNKQLLEAAGLEAPADLYERGEWTWDKWREYMIALTQDTDGDGVIDVYGYGSRFDFLVYNMLQSNGTTIASSGTENLSSPEVGEVLDFIYNMYNVDRVAKPWNVEDFDSNMNNYMDGSVAFYIDAAWISSQNKNAELGFDIVWCPWPIGPSGDAATNKTKNVSSGNAWMIPAGVEDPAFVYEVFEAWQNWYHGDTEYRDGDLTWWEDCAMTEENLAVMAASGERGGFDLWNALNIEYNWPALLDGTMTAAQFQETNKQLVQSALDVLFN
ncbi:MAG: extracellular solute-binding protein [Lachnospiraceae bacterium]|nr:extracellular solute-binding protein [Lachnospiraceae bacterium]MBR3684574.1 extracellular solute-binding protein [Lachnospiraceae bacterium]